MSTISAASTTQTPTSVHTAGELVAQSPQSKPQLIGKLSFGERGYVNLLKLADGSIGVQAADPKRAGASKIYTLNTGKGGEYTAKFVFPADLSDAKARVQQLVKTRSITLISPSASSAGVNLGDLGSAALAGLSGKPLTQPQQRAVQKVVDAVGQFPVGDVRINQIPKLVSGLASTVNRAARSPVLPTGDAASSVAHARDVANHVIKSSGTFHSLADLASVPGSAELHPNLTGKVAEANQLRGKINVALKADPGAVNGGFSDWKTLLTPAEQKKLDSVQAADRANMQVRTITADPSERQSFLPAVSGSVLQSKTGAVFLPALPITSRTPLSAYPATQRPLVANGEKVKKGQPLAEVSSPTLNKAESDAKKALVAERGNAVSAFRQYQASTAPQQAQLKNSDAAIAAAQEQVKLQQLQVSRYSTLVREGALAPSTLTEQQKLLEVANQNLATQKQARASLQAQIQTQTLPAGVTAESFVKQAEAGSLGNAGNSRYPDSLIASGTKVFAAKQAIEQLASVRESMTLRAPASGTITSVQIASSATTTGGGGSTTTLDGKSGAYQLGFTLVPDGPTGLGLENVNPKDAALFRSAWKSGAAVSIQDPVTGEFGTAAVASVSESPTATEGWRVVLANARIAGKPVDGRSQYRVYSSSTEPSTLASQSGKNVAYSPPSAVVASVDKLPFVTQEADVTVPVYSDRTHQPIGALKVKLVGTTDGRTLKLDATQTQAYFIANSGKNKDVPILQGISAGAIVSLVGPSRTGAKTGVEGSAALFSMQSIVVPDSTARQDSRADTDGFTTPISFSIPGVSVGITPSKMRTDTTGSSTPGIPSTATASFVVAPTGGGLIGQGGNALAVIGLPAKIYVHDVPRP